jgi:hypothetical protein
MAYFHYLSNIWPILATLIEIFSKVLYNQIIKAHV